MLKIISIVEEDSVEIGDFAGNADANNLPFISTDIDGKSENSSLNNDKMTAEDGVIDSGIKGAGPKFETNSEGDLPGSRKVSFHSDTKSLPDSRKNSRYENRHEIASHVPTLQFMHPVYSGIPLAPNYRKISSQTFGYFGEHSNQISSVEAFCYPPNMSKFPKHGKLSVFSIGSASDTGTVGQEDSETVPQLEHYSVSAMNYQRPTLYQLRDDKKGNSSSLPLADELADEENIESSSETKGVIKFGWIKGVFLRCILNIFGVMLFLRMTWMTGQAGIGFCTLIVAVSVLVTSLTTMSMSAICTNGDVKGGGAYYMISRSLGPEFGGSIGIVFSLANAIGAAMHILGFAETVQDILWEYDAQITNNKVNDVRIVAVFACILCLTIVFIGMEWESKAQMLFLAILVAALLDYFIGTFLPPTPEQKWSGFTGYNAETFTSNLVPHFTYGNNFFSVFAIFFPSATGILAGANISGDLKNPSTAIPKGTFLAILVTSLVYLGVIWTSGSCIVATAVGELSESVLWKDIVDNATTHNTTTRLYSPTIELVQDCWRFNKTCEGGLLYEKEMVSIASGWRPLILAGIFSATLSSALASMVSAPKIFQALANDKLFPGIHIFAKEYGVNREPKRAYLFCFLIAVGMVCIGSLDAIAPIISNFFLMSYALVNFACFDASMANSPGYRPGFKYYSKWLSLLGALLCVAIMFLINWWGALITIVLVAALHSYIHRNSQDINWGSSTQAHAYSNALKSALKLVSVGDHVKNFRPQILVLSGYPKHRSKLVDFAASITKKQSLLICGHILQGELETHVIKHQTQRAYKWFEMRKTKSFYSSVCASTFRIGVQVFLQTSGVGKLRPNTLLMGYKSDWLTADPTEVLDYFNVIQDAFDLHYGVGILRVKDGFDECKVPEDSHDHTDCDSDDDDVTKEEALEHNRTEPTAKLSNGLAQSLANVSNGENDDASSTSKNGVENKALEAENSTVNEISLRLQTLNEKQVTANTENDLFMKNKHYGTIDVWWLYDDGGLTLLIPYILRQRKAWAKCKLRVFCLASKKECNEAENKERMVLLLKKFRIEYSELTVITDVNKKPKLSTYREFETVIYDWRVKQDELQEHYPWKISDTNLLENKNKTYRQLRLREKLKEYSMDASLIVLTLPVPKKTSCPAGLYMGFLEILTRDMPQILLLRGNQESVLTYYS